MVHVVTQGQREIESKVPPPIWIKTRLGGTNQFGGKGRKNKERKRKNKERKMARGRRTGHCPLMLQAFRRSELSSPRVKAALCDESYTWIPKSQDFTKVQSSGFRETEEKQRPVESRYKR